MGAVALKVLVSLASSAMPGLAAGLGLTGFGATAFSYIATGLVSAIGGKLFGPKKKNQTASASQAAQDEGFMVNGQGSVASVPVVYGRRRIAGTRVYIESTNGSGDKSKHDRLQLVYCVAEGTIAQYEKVYFNNDAVWINDNIADPNTHTGTLQNYITGNEEEDQENQNKDYTGKIDINFYRGNQTAGTDIQPVVNAIGSDWTTNDYGGDLAWFHANIKYDRETFSGLPQVLVEITGRMIRNVNDLAAGTTNNKDECRNPANILYDFLTNDVFGKGIAESDLDLASFQDAHAYYDSKNIYFEGAINTSRSVLENLDGLLFSATAYLVYSQGQYHLRLNRSVDTTDTSQFFEFNTDNLVGGWNIILGEKSSRQNAIKTVFADPTNDWTENIVYIKDAAYLAEDNNTPLEQQVQLPFHSDKALATRMARFLLDQSRKQITVSFKAAHTALEVEVGDIVVVNHPTPGWYGNDKKLFRVVSISLNPESNLDITAIEYDSSVYAALDDPNYTE